MSGWGDLTYYGLRVRPWDGPPPARGGQYDRFKASFVKTIRLLQRELEMLNASRLLVELDVRERDIRLDGYPRADARPVGHPGVRVDFRSKHGPVRMETCEFTTWQANLRAIALSLEALRAVDRYGVSKRGEQYRGWAALPVSTDPADAVQTEEQAWAVIADASGSYVEWAQAYTTRAVREALRTTHPDQGGDPVEFRKVIRAREILNV